MKVGDLVVAMRKSGWCDTLVVVMNMLRSIRCHDKVSSSRVIVGLPASIKADDLVSSCSVFRG